MATLASVMSQYLNERETAIVEAIQSLRQQHETSESSLHSELEQTRRELAGAMEQLEKR